MHLWEHDRWARSSPAALQQSLKEMRLRPAGEGKPLSEPQTTRGRPPSLGEQACDGRSATAGAADSGGGGHGQRRPGLPPEVAEMCAK